MFRSRYYLTLISILLGSLGVLLTWAHFSSSDFLVETLPQRNRLVIVLSLTDLSLWTEARYTRHPAMSDLFSPFQDHPAAFEHFPAGAFLTPSGSRPETTLRIRHQGDL